MKWYGRINSLGAHRRKEEKYGLGRKMMTPPQVMPSPKKRRKAGNMSPKAHSSLTPQKINNNQNVQ